VVAATLTIKDKSPLANVPVRIEGKSAGDTNWRLLASATTGLDGHIEKPLIVGKSTTIRIFSDSTWERTEGVSTEMSVTVNRVLNVTAPGTAKAYDVIAITGNLRPRTAGSFIQIESLVGGVWKVIGQPVTTDAQGAFTFTVPGQSRGVLTLRITAAADALWSATTSPTFNIIIR